MEEDPQHIGVHRFSAGLPTRTVFQSLSTTVVRPPEQFDYWRDMVLRGVEATAPASRRCGYRGRVTSLATPAGEVHFAWSDAYSVSRSEALARADGGKELALFMMGSGKVSGRQAGDVELHARAGDFFLLDTTQALELAFSSNHIVQLNLPREAALAALGGSPAPTHVLRALRDARLSAMLRAQLAVLSQLAGTLDDHERALALQATETLAITVLRSALLRMPCDTPPDHADIDPHRHAEGLYLAACRHIEQEYARPGLDAARLAQAMGCSRSSLYRAFARHDDTVADHIRTIRLQRLRTLLTEAPLAVPIGELAARCGLYDTPNVSRMFRARYGMTPSQARRQPVGGTN